MTSPAPFEESESLKLARPFLGCTVDFVIDRPYGSHHPTYEFLYLANYGYVPGILAPGGDELDAYYLAPSEPMNSAQGICIALVRRLHDARRQTRRRSRPLHDA